MPTSFEKIDFGVGLSMPIKPESMKMAEEFIANCLGCPEISRNPNYTCFKFPNGQILGLTPDSNAPTEKEYENSTWLEVVSEDFDATKKRIQQFGAREVAGGMEEAFFFNIPGGAVFRLISREQAKAMSKE